MVTGITKSKQTITFLSDDGNNTDYVLYDPECEMSKRYPWLSFLVNDFREELWVTAEKNSAFAAKLSQVENYVKALAEATQEGKRLPDVPKFINAWYKGELDPGFYYSETNTGLFTKWLVDYCSRWIKTRYLDASGNPIYVGDVVRARTTKKVKHEDFPAVIESVVCIKRGEVVLMYEEYDDTPYPLKYCPRDSRHIMPATEVLPYWTNRLGSTPPDYLIKRHWPQNIE